MGWFTCIDRRLPRQVTTRVHWRRPEMAATSQRNVTSDETQLRQRLAAARALRDELGQRKKALTEALAHERTEVTEAQRRLGSAYEKLSSLLEGSPSVQATVEVGEDTEIVEAREAVAMLKDRLRAAKEVLRRHRHASRVAACVRLASRLLRHGAVPCRAQRGEREPAHAAGAA